MCCSQVPCPPVNGQRLQELYLSRELGRRHEVCMLAFAADDGEAPAAPDGVELLTVSLPPAGRRDKAVAFARGATRGYPVRPVRLGVAMAPELRRLLARRAFDVVHVSPGSLALVAPTLGDRPAVLAAIDAAHLNVRADALVATPALRPLYRLEAARMKRFEAHAYRPFRRVVLVSDADARALAKLDPALALEVIPNGVDSDAYAPDPSVAPEDGLIVFTGAMHYSPNVRAARELAIEILPRVREVRPDARLALVGRGPSPEVLELADLPGVTVTGEVPDVRPWLSRAQVYVCPMSSGTGIKNKLLEALACGSPCVASPLACQGTRLAHDCDLLVAEGAEATAAAVLTVLADPALRARLGPAGRRHVHEHHGWHSVGQAFERVYEAAIAEG